MRDLKAIKTVVLTCILTLAAAITTKAVIIEGFTPDGQFVTVGVSNEGRLLISASTGVAQAVFFITTQPVNALQGTSPWLVRQSSPITISVDSAVTTSASTAATLGITNFLINTVATQVLFSDLTRKGSLVCNDSTLSAFFGFTAGVTVVNGKLLPSGACLSLDNPSVYVGPLWINTTAAVQIGVVETTP